MSGQGYSLTNVLSALRLYDEIKVCGDFYPLGGGGAFSPNGTLLGYNEVVVLCARTSKCNLSTVKSGEYISLLVTESSQRKKRSNGNVWPRIFSNKRFERPSTL